MMYYNDVFDLFRLFNKIKKQNTLVTYLLVINNNLEIKVNRFVWNRVLILVIYFYLLWYVDKSWN